MSVSVAMCTYNGEKFLEQQLNSLSEQSLLPDEIVVFDDCSSDSTVEILRSFQLKTVIPLRLQINEARKGVVGNFEACLSACAGKYLALCDQDDIWLPNKLIHAVGTIKSMKICAFSSDVVAFYQDGSELLIKKSYRQKKFDHFFVV